VTLMDDQERLNAAARDLAKAFSVPLEEALRKIMAALRIGPK